MKKMKGITLISLIVTIIILLILAGISIQLIGGSNGILTRASQALDVNDQATATEKMELKITYLNMVSYGENTRKATLQELADGLFEDKEVEYVKLKNQEVATLQPIDVTGESSFFVKLKEYPYEFEIDENLQLASVDGVKIANTNSSSALTEEQINSIIDERMAQIEQKYATKAEVTDVQNSLNANMETLKKAQESTFVPDVLFEGTATSGDYTIKDLSSYKYIIVYMDSLWNNMRTAKSTRIINVSEIKYNNSATVKDNTSFAITETGTTGVYLWMTFWFKTSTKLHIYGTGNGEKWTSPRIYRIEGLK